MRFARPGFTILEVIVASVIFLMLLASLFVIYVTGANIWMKADTNTELLGKTQVLCTRISREVERSSFLSLTLDQSSQAASFLSSMDDEGQFQYDPFLNRPLWQNYLFFYRESTTGDIRLTKQSVLGTPAERTPLRVAGAADADRLINLTTFLTGGQLLVEGSTSLQFRILPVNPALRIENNERLEMTLIVEKDVRGQESPRRIESKTVMKFRN